MYNILD